MKKAIAYSALAGVAGFLLQPIISPPTFLGFKVPATLTYKVSLAYLFGIGTGQTMDDAVAQNTLVAALACASITLVTTVLMNRGRGEA